MVNNKKLSMVYIALIESKNTSLIKGQIKILESEIKESRKLIRNNEYFIKKSARLKKILQTVLSKLQAR